MPFPTEYASASADFDRFLDDLRVECDLETRHMAWQVAHSVLRVFRRHTDLRTLIDFASFFPPLIAVMILDELRGDHAPEPWPTDPALITAEVVAVRRQHSLTTERGIAQLAVMLRRHGGRHGFDEAVRHLPDEAAAFWQL